MDKNSWKMMLCVGFFIGLTVGVAGMQSQKTDAKYTFRTGQSGLLVRIDNVTGDAEILRGNTWVKTIDKQ